MSRVAAAEDAYRQASAAEGEARSRLDAVLARQASVQAALSTAQERLQSASLALATGDDADDEFRAASAGAATLEAQLKALGETARPAAERRLSEARAAAARAMEDFAKAKGREALAVEVLPRFLRLEKMLQELEAELAEASAVAGRLGHAASPEWLSQSVPFGVRKFITRAPGCPYSPNNLAAWTARFVGDL